MKKIFSNLSRGIIFVTAYACAAYQIEPTTVNHPANPDAVTAPQRSVSRTLAVSRTLVYTAAEVSAQKESNPAAAIQDRRNQPGTETPSKIVTGEGSVVAVVSATSQLVLHHGEIKDFMGPMTMGYQTESPSLLEGLKPGDRVRFSIDSQKKIIVKIEKIS